MAIKIKMDAAKDAFKKNELVKLEPSAYEETFAMAVANWIAKRVPRETALLEVLRFVYRSICERMSGYSLWLLLGDTCWQDDTRIIRHRKMFSSLKTQGIDFEALQDRQEFMVEQCGKLKFFGAVRLEEGALALVPETMPPGSCTYLLALPDVEPNFPHPNGWSGRLDQDFELVQSNVQNGGIIFQRIGYFDDSEVGLVALGRPEVVARLIA